MCIAFVKETDKDFPSEDTMLTCWKDNPDGAGYAWYDKEVDGWNVVKGLMTWNNFLERFNRDRERFNLDDKMVCVHFRVGTTGPKNGGATHPFPFLNVDNNNIHALEYTSKAVLFHNGTVGPGNANFSDTAMAAKAYWHLAPHIFEEGKANTGLLKILEEVLDTAHSRYALCYGDTLLMLGSWVEDKASGLFYSNDRFTKEKTFWWKRQQPTPVTPTVNDTIDSGISSPFGIIIQLPPHSRDSKAFRHVDSGWDWDKWEARYNTAPTPPNENLAEDMIKIYDGKGNVVYEVERKDKQKPTIHCMTCKLDIIDKTYLNDGECPGCDTLLDPDAKPKEDKPYDFRDVYKCPTCDEQSYIVDVSSDVVNSANYPELSDFTRCNKCSCVWGYTEMDTEWVIGYQDAGCDFIEHTKPLPKKDEPDGWIAREETA